MSTQPAYQHYEHPAGEFREDCEGCHAEYPRQGTEPEVPLKGAPAEAYLTEAQQIVAQLPEHPMARAEYLIRSAELQAADGDTSGALVNCRIAGVWLQLHELRQRGAEG
jgi:hypothetical protein